MSKYAVIQVAGKQYKVNEGETLEVNRLEVEPQAELTITDVLLVNDGKKVSVGQPFVAGAKVVCQVVDNTRGEKIRVATYKAKSRYRKVRGHRQDLTELKVTSISL